MYAPDIPQMDVAFKNAVRTIDEIKGALQNPTAITVKMNREGSILQKKSLFEYFELHR